MRLTLKAPSAADLSNRFEAVRDWVRTVADTPHVRIDWREWNHRVQGMQRLPSAVWVDTPQAALALIGKARHVYDDLRLDRLQPRVRLEQERVGFGWLSAQLRSSLR